MNSENMEWTNQSGKCPKGEKMKSKKEKNTENQLQENKDVLDLKKYSEADKLRIKKLTARLEKKPPKLKAEKNKSGTINLRACDTDPMIYSAKLYETFGTPDYDLQTLFLDQAMKTFEEYGRIEADDHEKVASLCNKSTSLLHGIQPRDEIEGMLAVQMLGVHNVAMETLKRAMNPDQSFSGKEANVTQATKMLRTFVQQIDALKRYRTGGQQKMTVEHVNINEGGQAIVGNVTQAGGRDNDK